MQRGKAALSVLAGIVALGIVAYRSPSVEGESARATVPTQIMTVQAPPDVPEAVTPAQGTTVADTSAVSASAGEARRTTRKSKAPSAPPGYRYWKTVRAKVTAYEPSARCCGEYANGRTSIGQSAWIMDGVAADPRAIPYGTYCVVPGVGGKTVDDTGGAMRDSWRAKGRYHIDVRMPYYSQAKRWGVKYLDIQLYKKVK
jgi:3D (Asp-Asp-Asp) domain-containing protein